MPFDNRFTIPDTCARCGNAMRASIMSRFNTDTICMGCERRERAHPNYQEAQAAELAAVRAGNNNFPGIGCPSDLYQPEVKEEPHNG